MPHTHSLRQRRGLGSENSLFASFLPILTLFFLVLIEPGTAQTFFAAHPDFVGLDQVNVVLPRTLLGRGYHRLKVGVGERTSNELEFELALPDGSTSMPTAAFDSIILDEDTRQMVRLAGSDPEGRPLFYAVTSQPQHGGVSGDGAEREYQPVANYNGTDALTFKVNNGLGDSATATVTLLVRPVNDPPTLSFVGPASIFAGEQLVVNMTGSDIDGNQNLTCEAVDLPEGAVFSQDVGGGQQPVAGAEPGDVVCRRARKALYRNHPRSLRDDRQRGELGADQYRNG